MVIKIDLDKHDEIEIMNLLNNNQIHYTLYDNEYIATCREEIEQAIDCADSFIEEGKTFYDILGDKANNVIWELAKDLYNAKESNDAFQELAEAAQLIVNRKIHEIKGE